MGNIEDSIGNYSEQPSGHEDIDDIGNFEQPSGQEDMSDIDNMLSQLSSEIPDIDDKDESDTIAMADDFGDLQFDASPGEPSELEDVSVQIEDILSAQEEKLSTDVSSEESILELGDEESKKDKISEKDSKSYLVSEFENISESEKGKTNEEIVEIKEEYIEEKEKTIRSRSSESFVPIEEGDTPEAVEEKERQRENIEKDLESVNLDTFYNEYLSVLNSDADGRPWKIRQLKIKLGKDLNGAAFERGVEEEEPYNSADVGEIFDSLTTSQQMNSVVLIIFQKRLLIAMEIDEKYGTKIGPKIKDTMNKPISANQKLKDIDEMLDNISKIKTKDKELQKKLDELNSLNKLQDTATEEAERKLVEEKISLEVEAEMARKRLDEVDEINFPEMTEDEIRLFSDHIESGSFELVDMALRKRLGADAEIAGVFKADVKGEDVYFDRRDGKLVAYLKYGDNREIHIERTEPDAIGFDLARSTKIALQMGWADIAKREDIRWTFLDAPGDERFMNKGESEKFSGLLSVLLQGATGNNLAILRELSILDNNSVVDKRISGAFKRQLESWASGGNIKDLKGDVTHEDLLKLANIWKRSGSGELEIYELQDVRSS